jgi:hypothetical protein
MGATDGDLTRVPLAYPLAPVDGPRLLLAGCEHPVRQPRGKPLAASRAPWCDACARTHDATARRRLGALLADLGEAPLADRTPVLAVGSNAAPAVLRHKLGSRGVSTVVPVLTGVVRALDVTHSAHVARGGYVPAAPVHRSRSRRRAVLQLLDDDQLAAVDETEPNYDRVEVSAARYPVVLSGGLRPGRVHVYTSRRGVLDLPDRPTTALLTQTEVLAALDGAGVPHTGGDPHEAAGLLARSPEVREAVHAAMDDLGLVRDAGLHAQPADELRWADALAPSWPRRGGISGGRHPVPRRPRRAPRTPSPPRTPRRATGPQS